MSGMLVLGPPCARAQNPTGDSNGPPLVNQAGYSLGEVKRFTVPGAADGTAFRIRRHLHHLMEKLSSRLAYQFFIGVRGGTDLARYDPTKVAGGGPSRDGGYTLETPFEVLPYASNPALFDRWTDELAPADTPDLVDLTLWHAAFAYQHVGHNRPTGTRSYHIGYEGRPMQTYDYQNHLDQLAAIAGAYRPFLHRYLDEATYRKNLATCRERWEAHDRHKGVRHWVKSDKRIDAGWQEFNETGNARGQAVFRNLVMHLAERGEADGRPERYLRYAQDATRDVVRTVTETGANTGRFTAALHVAHAGAGAGETTVVAQLGDKVEISYGYLGFQNAATLTVGR